YVRRLAVAGKMFPLGLDANQHLEFFRGSGLLTASEKEAWNRRLALLDSRGARGDSLGGSAGLFPVARRIAARHRWAAPAGASLFSESLLVAAGAPLRRPAVMDLGLHAGHRRSFVCSALRQCGRCGLDCSSADSFPYDLIGNPRYRH